MKKLLVLFPIFCFLLFSCSDTEPPPAEQFTELSLNHSVSGTISARGEVDWYHFRAVEANNILKISCSSNTYRPDVDLLVGVYREDEDGERKVKIVIPYPRDVAACAKLLQEVARGGVLPERPATLPTPSAQTEEPPARIPRLPVLGVDSDFRRVTATAADGTQYTAEVKPGDVIEAKAEEVQDG